MDILISSNLERFLYDLCGQDDGVVTDLMKKLAENGKYEVPYIGLEPISVDKNNINDVIIGSGFHLKEDVYLNIPSEMPQ